MIKTLLFDLDGVLVRFDSTRSKIAFIRLALMQMAKTYGFKKSYLAMTAAKKAMEENTDNLLTNEERAIKAFAEVLRLDPQKAGGIYTDITHQIFPQLKKYFYPIAEAQSFIQWAQGHYDFYLTTNPLWPREMALNRLSWGNIEAQLFKEITHFSNMHYAKPHTNYYSEILEKFNLRADEVMMIGDSFKKDAPATKLGIKTFILSEKIDNNFKNHFDQKFLHWGSYHDLKMLLTTLTPGKK